MKRPSSSSATALPRAPSMSAITTCAPRPARCRATPSPMPLLPPVMSATLPSTSSAMHSIVGERSSVQPRSGRGERLGVHDAEMLDGAGHGDVEQPEASAVVAGDGCRLDHDHGVELETLGRGCGDDGDRPGHGVALEHPDVGLAGARDGSPRARGPRGRRPPPGRGARPAWRPPRPAPRRASSAPRAPAARWDRSARPGWTRSARMPGAATGRSREAKSSTRPGAR